MKYLSILELLLNGAQAQSQLRFGFGLAHLDLGFQLQGDSLLLAPRRLRNCTLVPKAKKKERGKKD